MSQAAKMQDHLNHIDFRRPTKAMANGLSGLAMSDSRSLISGTVVPPDGTRLPAASAPGSKNHRNGMDQSGLYRLQGPWVSEPTNPISTSSRPPNKYDEVMGITQVDPREAERFEEGLNRNSKMLKRDYHRKWKPILT